MIKFYTKLVLPIRGAIQLLALVGYRCCFNAAVSVIGVADGSVAAVHILGIVAPSVDGVIQLLATIGV